MRANRGLITLILPLALLLSACGDDDTEPSSAPGGSSSESAPVDSGEGDSDGSGATATLNVMDCSAITAEEMAPLLGDGVGSAEVPPGGGNCTYSLDDPSLPTAALSQLTVNDYADGFDGAKANIANVVGAGTIDGTASDVPGIGDGAVVIAGSTNAGTMGVGLVLLGEDVVRVWVLPGSDLSTDRITEITTGILELVASKA
ncbi:hypothetical protein [Nocardioides sp. R-C-SC26]|uniref:hypothetical protein n=1 Tax=Nocardioides sp. R-C-SC26 TaxID=2870414 RepID=UPI001E5BE408|nr:hypothetical protein [Nocardioides sp. R-C-SC26]